MGATQDEMAPIVQPQTSAPEESQQQEERKVEVTSGAQRFRQGRSNPAFLERPAEEAFDITKYNINIDAVSPAPVPVEETRKDQLIQRGKQILAQQSVGHLISNPNNSSPLYQSPKYSYLFQELEGKVSTRYSHTEKKPAEELFADFLSSCEVHAGNDKPTEEEAPA